MSSVAFIMLLGGGCYCNIPYILLKSSLNYKALTVNILQYRSDMHSAYWSDLIKSLQTLRKIDFFMNNFSIELK